MFMLLSAGEMIVDLLSDASLSLLDLKVIEFDYLNVCHGKANDEQLGQYDALVSLLPGDSKARNVVFTSLSLYSTIVLSRFSNLKYLFEILAAKPGLSQSHRQDAPKVDPSVTLLLDHHERIV